MTKSEHLNSRVHIESVCVPHLPALQFYDFSRESPWMHLRCNGLVQPAFLGSVVYLYSGGTRHLIELATATRKLQLNGGSILRCHSELVLCDFMRALCPYKDNRFSQLRQVISLRLGIAAVIDTGNTFFCRGLSSQVQPDSFVIRVNRSFGVLKWSFSLQIIRNFLITLHSSGCTLVQLCTQAHELQGKQACDLLSLCVFRTRHTAPAE